MSKKRWTARSRPSKPRRKYPTENKILLPSPVVPFPFGGRTYYVKRDDLIHPDFSGNKYRKLYRLLHTDDPSITRVYSHGGTQSNAMLSIAALCALKGWAFHYTCKRATPHLNTAASGNYARALRLGMRPHEVDAACYAQSVADLREAVEGDKHALFIPQGGADPAAAEGIAVLAAEIREWMRETAQTRLTVATPSGTGTTAGYLAAALPECRVVTVAAVGGGSYLEAQICRLMPFPENLEILATRNVYRFGEVNPELYAIHRMLLDAGIEFDLLYAPVMWKALLEQEAGPDETVLYVHSGGLGGNASMQERYERYFELKERETGKKRRRGKGAKAP